MTYFLNKLIFFSIINRNQIKAEDEKGFRFNSRDYASVRR